MLAALLAAVQTDLWFGRSGMPNVVRLERELESQSAANELARQRNRQLAAEVDDLKDGLEMVEEKARGELGMLRPDEILVQITRPR